MSIVLILLLLSAIPRIKHKLVLQQGRVPYSGKLLREKTFCKFCCFAARVFGIGEQSTKVFSTKSHFPIRESFLP